MDAKIARNLLMLSRELTCPFGYISMHRMLAGILNAGRFRPACSSLIQVDRPHGKLLVEWVGLLRKNQLALLGAPQSIDLAAILDPDLFAAASQGLKPDNLRQLARFASGRSSSCVLGGGG